MALLRPDNLGTLGENIGAILALMYNVHSHDVLSIQTKQTEQTALSSFFMRSAGLDELQAGIKTDGRNINNLRCVDDTTLMAESEEELNSLLMKVKEESEKADLNLNIQKMKIMASGKKVKTVADFIFLSSRITEDGDCSHEIKRHLLLGRKAMTNLGSILKNRHHFTNKGLYIQSYGFSSSHVWM